MKAELADHIQYVRAEVLRLREDVALAERDAPGTIEQWSYKDLLALVTNDVVEIADYLSGEIGELADRDPAAFDADYYRLQYRSWEEIWAEMELAYSRLFDLLASLSEEELAPEIDIVTRAMEHIRPLWMDVAAYATDRPASFISRFLQQRGKELEALDFQKELYERNRRLSDDPIWNGSNSYDLARIYARSGDAEKAAYYLSESGEASLFMPYLASVEPDFDPVRNDPRLKDIIKDLRPFLSGTVESEDEEGEP